MKFRLGPIIGFFFCAVVVSGFVVGFLASAQVPIGGQPIVTNRLSATPGSDVPIAVATGAASEVIPGDPARKAFCLICTVAVNYNFGDSLNNPPNVEPSSSTGVPLAASTVYCVGPYSSPLVATEVRLDAIATASAGTCSSIEFFK